MTNQDFEIWKSNHPEIVKDFLRHRKNESSNWGRIVAYWKENVNHTYYRKNLYLPIINLENGNIYLASSKKSLYGKFCVQVFARPLYSIGKMLYHLCLPVSLSIITVSTIQKGKIKHRTSFQIFQKCLLKDVKSVIDTVQTPLSGIILTIYSLAIVMITPLYRQKIYDYMEVAGKIERFFNWGKFHNLGTLYHCFQPFANLMTIGKQWGLDQSGYPVEKKDTYYSDDETDLERGLNHFVRSQIKFRRKFCQSLFPDTKMLSELTEIATE